jgi:glycosyltransferase involved in cell wall biosynthesis
MKILQLCNKPPVPSIDGGTIAMNNLTKGLHSANSQIHVMAIATPKHPYHPTAISDEYKKAHQPSFVYINTLPTAMGAIKGLFQSESYHINRFFSHEFNTRLIDKLKSWQPDIVIFESLFVQPYYGTVVEHSSAKIIYRAHNIEYTLWQKRYNDERNPLKKWLLGRLLPKLKETEKEFVQSVDAIVPISSLDEKTIVKWAPNKPTELIPFGYDFSRIPETVPTKKEKSLIYLGALDWQPNIDGLKWFTQNCWPDIHKKHPSWIFKIAGRNAYSEVDQIRGEGIEYIGEVDSAWEYYQSGGIMVVPLFTGSGMRIKIIEAMAAEIPLVSTSQGVEGISCTPERHYELADNQNQFVQSIIKLIEDSEYRKTLASNANDLVRKHHDCFKQGEILLQFLKSI